MSIEATQLSLDPIINFLKARRPDLAEIPPEMDLVDNRVIDSLDFVEVVFLIEEITGKEISLDEISVDKLKTLRAIEEGFFAG